MVDYAKVLKGQGSTLEGGRSGGSVRSDQDKRNHRRIQAPRERAKAWNAAHSGDGETEEAAEEAPAEEAPAEETAAEETATSETDAAGDEKGCPICSTMNAADAGTCGACGYTFTE